MFPQLFVLQLFLSLRPTNHRPNSQLPSYPDDLTLYIRSQHVDVECGKAGAVIMNVTDQSAPSESAPPTRPQLTKTPIAQLSPALAQPEDKCIYATVSLVWPYSSSTKSLALLLAEPDFRLRRPNGQVKAVFHGRVAETVAEQHIGIGETLCLSLKDSTFAPNDAATQSSGRSIAWDLHFDRGVTLEVNQTRKRKSLATANSNILG